MLTLNDHKEIAETLHDVRDAIHDVLNVTNEKLPKRSRASEAVVRLVRAYEQVRCLLDAAMYDQYVDAPEPSPYFKRGVGNAR